MWRLIGITPAIGVEREQERIVEYLNDDIDIFHIRKPSLSDEELKIYLSCFPQEIRRRLTLHGSEQIALEMGLGGVHYNVHNPYRDTHTLGLRKSYSCHSIAEVIDMKDKFDYIFLSPIYNSISKQGYKSNFSLQDLKTTKLIDERVIALGGVSMDKYKELRDCGFGGAALLGSLWSESIDK